METNRRIRVIVCDSTPMSAEALARGLRDPTVSCASSIEVCGWTANAQEILALAETTAPDVAVIALLLMSGRQFGLSVIEALQHSAPATKSVLLVDNFTRDAVLDGFRAGAKGILDRSRDFDALYRCITAVGNGDFWANTTEIRYLIEAIGPASKHIVNSKGERLLTSREEQVRLLVTDGLSNKDIAATLDLSEHTVKNYMFHIFDKLGVSSRVELILYGQHHSATTDSAQSGDLPGTSRPSPDDSASSTVDSECLSPLIQEGGRLAADAAGEGHRTRRVGRRSQLGTSVAG